jgi:RNA polymerase sigma factor (sigma-70 family)
VEGHIEGSPSLELEVTALYSEHSAGLLHYAASISRDSDLARDAVQEVYLRYFMERRAGREIRQPRAWLFQCVRNQILNSLRTASQRTAPSDVLKRQPADHQTPEAILAVKQMATQAAAALTRRERACLELRVDGHSYGEIGRLLDIRSGTVGVLLGRAYRKLGGPALLLCSRTDGAYAG